MFEDESWIMKIIIGGILLFIPIVNFMVLGYQLEVLKRVADGMDIPLPEWDDFVGKSIEGLLAFLIALVYNIPTILVVCLPIGLIAMAGAADSAVLMSMARLVTACAYCVLPVWGIVVLLILPAAIIRYATTGELMSAFQFGEIFGFIRDNIANYIVAIILWIVANFIAGFGVIACFVGVLFTEFWAYLVMAHLLGQVQRESLTVA